MDNIKYSIIIPHKNIPDLLDRCLKSIPQSNDFQVIIVDDNSDSSIVNLANFPGLNNPNTEVYFTKENKGAGYARNVGLQYAKGKWILFADADDFFNPCFKSAIESHYNSSSDVIYFSATSVMNDTFTPSNRHEGTERAITNYKSKDAKSEEDVKFSNWEPWARMFNANYIKRNQLSFDEVMTGNDAGFVLKAGYYSKKISVDKSQIYCVTYRTDSLSYNKSEKDFDNRFKAILLLNSYMIKFGKTYFRPIKPVLTEGRKYGLRKVLSMFFLARKYIFHKLKKKITAPFSKGN